MQFILTFFALLLIFLLKIVIFAKKSVYLALEMGIYWLFKIYRKLINIQNGCLHGLNGSKNFDFQIAFSYFTSDFDQVCGRLQGLIRACMSGSLAFNVAVPLKCFQHAFISFPKLTLKHSE